MCFLSHTYCKSVLFNFSLSIILVLCFHDNRTGRMAYVKVMLMDLSCMRTGIKIYDFLVTRTTVDNNYFRFLLLFFSIHMFFP